MDDWEQFFRRKSARRAQEARRQKLMNGIGWAAFGAVVVSAIFVALTR